MTSTARPDAIPLVDIALNEADLTYYFYSIHLDEELVFIEQEADTWMYWEWEQRLPSDLTNNFTICYYTTRKSSEEGDLFAGYEHFNQILVFSSAEEAHQYFLNATSYMGIAELTKTTVKTVGDESFGFVGTWETP